MSPTYTKFPQRILFRLKKTICTPLCMCILFIGISTQVRSNTATDKENLVMDQLDVYPPLPNDLYKSDRYTVAVKQGSMLENSYVYMDPNTFPLPARSMMTDDNHWTSFSFDGSVEVTVTLSNRTRINSAQIRPLSYNIDNTISGNTVTFTLTKASNIYLEIDGEEKNPIFIFANPMEVNPPSENGSNVIVFEPGVHNVNAIVNGDFSNKTLYFKPGIHDVGLSIDKLSTNSTVYIAGGAYVKGLLHGVVNKDHISIRGRGILSGIEFAWTPEWALHLVELPGSERQTDIQIEGITFTNAPKSSIITRGATTVDNIKMLLFGRNSDGISSGANSVIKNSFFKVNDDVIKLFDNNITVYHNVIWHQPIAAIFQMSWKEKNRVTNIEIYDIDVIHFDRNLGSYELFLNSALLACRNINGGSFDNINLHDIRLEHKPYQLLGLMMKDNRLSAFQDGLGSIEGINFSNIHMETKPKIKSFLNANGTQTGEINNISFCNIYEAGVKLTSVDDILTIENPTKTNNITISASDFANAGPAQTLSCNASSEVTLQGVNAGAGYTYMWTTNDGNILSGADTIEAIVDQQGTYTLTVISPSRSCSDIDTVIVQKNSPFSIDAGEDKNLLCGETDVNIGLDNPSQNQFSFSWETEDGHIVSGEDSMIAIVDAAGTYVLRVVDSNGCSDFDIVRVVESTSFSADAGLSSLLTCTTPEVTLGSTNTLPQGYTFQWSTNDGHILHGENEPNARVNASGSYTLTITAPNGCSAQDTVDVSESPLFGLDLGEDLIFDKNDIILTLGEKAIDDLSYQYLWETSDGNIISDPTLRLIEINQAGTYVLSVIEPNNQCTITDEVVVANEFAIEDESVFMYPNPTYDTVTLVDPSQSVELINFHDTKGRVVLTWNLVEQGNEVNVSNLSPGLYFITYDIVDNNQEMIQKSFKIIVR